MMSEAMVGEGGFTFVLFLVMAFPHAIYKNFFFPTAYITVIQLPVVGVSALLCIEIERQMRELINEM